MLRSALCPARPGVASFDAWGGLLGLPSARPQRRAASARAAQRALARRGPCAAGGGLRPVGLSQAGSAGCRPLPLGLRRPEGGFLIVSYLLRHRSEKTCFSPVSIRDWLKKIVFGLAVVAESDFFGPKNPETRGDYAKTAIWGTGVAINMRRS